MLGGFEEEDFELIKDYLCEENTAWNTTGRNPNSVSHLSLRPEAKLWNTFVKRNLMPTSHNQTVDRTRLLLIHRIITGYRINVGEILAKELATTSPATTPAARERSRASTRDTPLGTTPSSPSPPAPAQSDETAPPLHILQLRSQLQRIEARQIHFQEEMKVFNKNLLKFLHFQFPSASSFFAQPSTTPPQPNISAAAQPSANTSAKAGATEEVNFSSDDENDVFDWQSPRDHLQPLGPTTTTPAPAVPILSAAPTPMTSIIAERPTPYSPARRKGKSTAGRSFGRDIPSSPDDEEAEQRPAKRRRKYHVIVADSDDDDSNAGIPVSKPMQSADPSLSSSI
ncbi:hypothetical protein GQ457_01G016530 [Hibiscus cannabinus]